MFKMGNCISLSFQRACARFYASFLILSVATTSSIPANSFSVKAQEMVQGGDFSEAFNPMWIFECLSSFDENTTAEEIVQFAAKVKIEVERITGEYFPIEQVLYQCREEIEGRGVEMDWDHFNDFVEHVKEAEEDLLGKESGLVAKRRPKRRPDPFLDNASDHEIIGFMECFCGVLFCILPWGVTQWVGGTLLVDGASRMGGGAIDRISNKHSNRRKYSR